MSSGFILSGAVIILASILYSIHSFRRYRKAVLHQHVLGKRVAILERELEKQKELCTLDPLTGIPNRRRFAEAATAEWKRMKRNRQFLTIIMIDIDNFKRYNDEKGHQAGDSCLRTVAGNLKASLNRSGDFVARYGGEEFCVILPDTDRSGAKKVGERMQQRIEADGVVTISIGTASVVPGDEYSCDELIEAADRALYRAKDNGRNRVEISEEVPDEN